MDSWLMVPAVSEFCAFFGTIVDSKFWKLSARALSSSSFCLRFFSCSSGVLAPEMRVRLLAVCVPKGRWASLASRKRAEIFVRNRAYSAAFSRLPAMRKRPIRTPSRIPYTILACFPTGVVAKSFAMKKTVNRKDPPAIWAAR